MRLNGFGKYIDVEELWPNKNACSAFASSFATTENAAWHSVPQLEGGKAHITTHLCPSPSGQLHGDNLTACQLRGFHRPINPSVKFLSMA